MKMKWDTWICGTALWGKKKCTREMACIVMEGGFRFCRGTVRGGCQWLGYSTIFKLVGQGGLTKKAQNVQEDSRCKGIQGITSTADVKCVEHIE